MILSDFNQSATLRRRVFDWLRDRWVDLVDWSFRYRAAWRFLRAGYRKFVNVEDDVEVWIGKYPFTSSMGPVARRMAFGVWAWLQPFEDGFVFHRCGEAFNEHFEREYLLAWRSGEIPEVGR